MNHEADVQARPEVRDGMRITWHQPIAMSDGIVLRADVYRPIEDGQYPVILSHGIYAKGLPYQDGYPMQWEKMVKDHPEILVGSTNKYQAWEVTDPERWVPHGYAVVRVDSRGSGWSPGFMDPLCPQEDDYEYEGEIGEFGKKFVYGTRGTGGMTHNDDTDRPRDVFGGRVTLHAGGGRESYLLVPIIPPKAGG